jgi:hypothetical protein
MVAAAAERTDGKLQNIFLGTGLQITLAAGIKAGVAGQRLGVYTGLYFAGALSAYVLMFLCIFWALRPRIRSAPISSQWEELYKRYFNKSEEQVLDCLIVDYQVAIDQAARAGSAKARGLDIVMGLFVATLALLVAGLWLS